MLVARATGAPFDLDTVDRVESDIAPDQSMLSCYAALRPSADAAATAVIELGR